jgi:hypothetical protein
VDAPPLLPEPRNWRKQLDDDTGGHAGDSGHGSPGEKIPEKKNLGWWCDEVLEKRYPMGQAKRTNLELRDERSV